MAVQANPTDPLTSIVGRAPAIEALRAQIRRLAPFDTPQNPNAPTVLLQGETGSGKGLVARTLHATGGRARGPFVDVNCAAIPESMLEAELFGYEAGAFTDAKRAKPGLFETAAGGTLFLDEIDALPLALQGKLLKAIEEKTIRRLGAVAPQTVNVKLIAATQRDLGEMIAAGTFRADLYHRLAVVVLEVPALHARGDDVLVLAEHQLAQHAHAHGVAPKRLDDGARAWLVSHDWPGNVRELSHLMERATLLCPESDLDAATLASLTIPLPRAATAPAAPRSVNAAADDEAARIRDALARSGGNVVAAARLLGIGRNALRHRMQRFGIVRPTLQDLAGAPPRGKAAAAATASARRVDDLPARPASPATGTPSWEQRPVAVLAIDVVLRDGAYEPWTVTRRWEATIVERVTGFGGLFLSRSPSRLTVVFGIPRTIEQLPQRAVQAALAIARFHADDPTAPELRMAVHVGAVRFDADAPDDPTRVLPIGDTLALPERLLGHAGAGEILVSAPVARRVASSCELRPRELRVGDAGTLHVAVVAKRRATAAGETPAATRFVGREREAIALRESFDAAAAGSGLVVFAVGDAGLGKSRLIAEFRAQLAGIPHTWIEGRCASYGTTTAFLPIVDALRRLFGIEDRDDAAAVREKIAAGVAAIGADLAWIEPYVAHLLGVDAADGTTAALDYATRRSETFRALKELLRAAAVRQPTVIVVEDLHWIDPASEELLAFLADAVPAMRALLVCSHRPGYRHPFGDRSYHVRIALRALSIAEMAAVSGSLLGVDELPAEVAALVAAKAEGNPFFVEEMTRSLLEDGTLRRQNGHVVLARDPSAIVVPDTIQDVLGARLDRLADDARRAIQVASVIGREFALRLLERITETGERVRLHVDELRALELIYEKATHPELAYMFKHALTHDVAYESVLGERRRELHRTIGLAIEELYADRLAEFYETLAHHFGRAEDWERALAYHGRAAAKAAESFANRSVITHCREALAIADRLGAAVPLEQRRDLEERLGLALFYVSEYPASGVSFERAADHSDAPPRCALNLAQAATSHSWAHAYDRARAVAARISELAAREGMPAIKALATALEAFEVGVCGGDVMRERTLLQEALQDVGAPGDEVTRTLLRFYLAQNAEWIGDYQYAMTVSEEIIAAGRRLRLAHLVIWPGWFLGKAACCLGEYGRALAQLTEAYEFCDRIGDRAWRSRLLNTIGWCLAEIGAHDRARDYNTRAAALAREVGDPEIVSNSEINLAGNELALGNVEGALRHLEPIRSTLAVPGDPWMRWRYSLHAYDLSGRVALARGAPEEALVHADEQLAGARRHHAPKLEARALALRGAALLALDRRDDAGAALRDAVTVADAIGYARAAREACRLAAEVARRDGRSADVARWTERHDALAAAAARSLPDAGLRRIVAAGVAPPS